MFQARGKCHSLNERQEYRSVASVLVDFAPARLAFLLSAARWVEAIVISWIIRRRNVRHDAQRKDGHAEQRAAGEHVEHAENAPCMLLENVSKGFGSMPGMGT